MDRPHPMEEDLPQDEDQKSSAPNPLRRGLDPPPQAFWGKGDDKKLGGGKLDFSLASREELWYKPIMEERRLLYLKVGDWVIHHKYPEWGTGLVVEERNSSVLGGLSYVKVTFRDGQTRIFDNNFKNATCCYHAGLRRR